MTTLATREEAREGTDHIVARVSDLLPLIKEAFERRYDLALDYSTWAEYCDAELRGLRLPVEARREAITELTNAGMTTRAVGQALGVSRETVRRDLAGDTNVSPANRVVGLDGKNYIRTRTSSEPTAEPTPDTTAADEEHARQVRVATSLLTDAVVTLSQINGTHVGELFDPTRANELSRPVTQDTILAAIEALDAVLAAFRERNLP